MGVMRVATALRPTAAACARAVFHLCAHGLFCLAVGTIALAADGAFVSWAAVFLPLLASIFFELVYAAFRLLRGSSQMDERAVFARAIVVFVLLIGFASAVLASLVAYGVQITPSASPFLSVPSIDTERGTFARQWQPNSAPFTSLDSGDSEPNAKAYGDTTAFVRVNDAFELAGNEDSSANGGLGTTLKSTSDLSSWIGLNVSEAQIRRLYDPAKFNRACLAFSEESNEWSRCRVVATTKYSLSMTNEYCGLEDRNDEPSGQLCAQDVLNAARHPRSCGLYVEPQAILAEKENLELARRIANRVVTRAGAIVCSDRCQYQSDGVCDDGSQGALYDVCTFGQDCTDCGHRSWHELARERLSSFPSCGYFGSENEMPQRYFAPWVPHHKTQCKTVCSSTLVRRACGSLPASLPESTTRCHVPDRQPGWIFLSRAGVKGEDPEWCCDDLYESRPVAEALVVPPGLGTGPDACLQACLVRYYADQEACTFTQHNAATGECARIEIRDRLCSQTEDGRQDCSATLTHRDEHGATQDTQRPAAAQAPFGFAQIDPWTGVHTAPRDGAWTEYGADWTIYVMLGKATADGTLPSDRWASLDMQLVLAPFICIPLLLGLLIVCLCCSPLNVLPDTRILDEDVCAWDYACFRGPPYLHAHLHNFRILLLAFSISISALMLFFEKTVSGADYRVSWSITLAPFWVLSFFIVLTTIGLAVRAWQVVRSRSSAVSARLSGRSSPATLRHGATTYKLATDKGRFVLRAFTACMVFAMPCVVSLVLMGVRLETCSSLAAPKSQPLEDSGSVPAPSASNTPLGAGGCWFTAIETVLPLFAGLVLHVVFLLAYFAAALLVQTHRWYLSRMESLELEIRSMLRQEKAERLAQLKHRFMQSDASSAELVQLMRLLVFEGQDFAVSHEEVRMLGHAKLALLTQEGVAAEVWTGEVAREFGELLRYLLARPTPTHCIKPRLRPGVRVRLADIGFFSPLRGFCLLVLRPDAVRRRLLVHLSPQGAPGPEARAADERRFEAFLSDKARVANQGGLATDPEEAVCVNGHIHLAMV